MSPPLSLLSGVVSWRRQNQLLPATVQTNHRTPSTLSDILATRHAKTFSVIRYIITAQNLTNI